MHFEILDPLRMAMLESLYENIDLHDFYLAGGTGLSLRMKLRKSYDFVFFTQSSFNENSLFYAVQAANPDRTEVLMLNKGTCSLVISGIQVSFFEYPYPLLEKPISSDRLKGLQIAGLADIAAMKMSAIGSRGAKKDFFDLYYILQRADFSSEQLINDLKTKFGRDFNFSYMLMGLDYFDDAEQETLPELFVDFDWRSAKNFFAQKKKELIDLVHSGYKFTE